MSSEFVGVDGCHAGWFSVGFDSDGGVECRVHPTFDELLARYREAQLILIDIPIGLQDGPMRRECDVQARQPLGSRHSTVFTAPTRQTAQQAAREPKNYNAAKELELQVTGRRISKQAFAIAPKIAEVESVLNGLAAGATPVVREVHPEICFWALNGRQPMTERKSRTAGVSERRVVLQAIEPRTQHIYDTVSGQFRRKVVKRDDILDALAAAVTAREGSMRNELQTIPVTPTTDTQGLPMEMVYWEPEESNQRDTRNI